MTGVIFLFCFYYQALYRTQAIFVISGKIVL